MADARETVDELVERVGQREAMIQILADNIRYREALSLIAEASDIRDAVPEVRQIAREALQPSAANESMQ